MIQNIKKWELLFLIALTILFPFLATNYNSGIGQIYSIFTLAAIVYLIVDPVRSIQFKNQNDSLITSVVIAVVAVIVFILFSTFIVIPGTKALLDLLASSTPVLANDPFTNKIVFGILVASAETLFFFVYLFDLLLSVFNISLDNLKNPKLWWLVFAICILFTTFHLTAKLTTNTADSTAILLTVFFMAAVSLILVIWRKQALEALIFHILLNSLSVSLISFKILTG
jgi:hypothetical protein